MAKRGQFKPVSGGQYHQILHQVFGCEKVIVSFAKAEKIVAILSEEQKKLFWIQQIVNVFSLEQVLVKLEH